eukprot:m.84166 g.84166  ORF g.84166 m.84166 type:complete len:315 (-) comp14791_c0_seq2:96-1040(-)
MRHLTGHQRKPAFTPSTLGSTRTMQYSLESSKWWTTSSAKSLDNGGVDFRPWANLPLSGFKGTMLEGGVRAAAFVSGPVIPAHAVGTRTSTLVHISDWYATFSTLADMPPDDDRAVGLGLPPTSSFDAWSGIINDGDAATNATTRKAVLLRTQHFGKNVVVGQRYKLVTGIMSVRNRNIKGDPGVMDGKGRPALSCNPCIFDLHKDPGELTNIAARLDDPNFEGHDEVALLKATVESWSQNEHLQAASKKKNSKMHCKAARAAAAYGGVWGPWETEACPKTTYHSCRSYCESHLQRSFPRLVTEQGCIFCSCLR